MINIDELKDQNPSLREDEITTLELTTFICDNDHLITEDQKGRFLILIGGSDEY